MSSLKELVGKEIAGRVENGCRLGIGTGSTVDAAVRAIGERIKSEGLKVECIPTSLQTSWLCAELGLTVLDECVPGELDWAFDGADAVDSQLMAIKGLGGALLREKIVAARAKQLVLIVDESKVVENLADGAPVPIEVVPSAYGTALGEITSLGAVKAELREGDKRRPILTQSGNIIIDATFSSISRDLEAKLNAVVGVVENGIFTSMATEILIGTSSGISTIAK